MLSFFFGKATGYQKPACEWFMVWQWIFPVFILWGFLRAMEMLWVLSDIILCFFLNSNCVTKYTCRTFSSTHEAFLNSSFDFLVHKLNGIQNVFSKFKFKCIFQFEQIIYLCVRIPWFLGNTAKINWIICMSLEISCVLCFFKWILI